MAGFTTVDSYIHNTLGLIDANKTIYLWLVSAPRHNRSDSASALSIPRLLTRDQVLNQIVLLHSMIYLDPLRNHSNSNENWGWLITMLILIHPFWISRFSYEDITQLYAVDRGSKTLLTSSVLYAGQHQVPSPRLGTCWDSINKIIGNNWMGIYKWESDQLSDSCQTWLPSKDQIPVYFETENF